MAGDIAESFDNPKGAPERQVQEILAVSEIRTASNILVLGPMDRSLDDRACAACFDSLGDESRDVVFVSLTQHADDRLEILQKMVGFLPARVTVVSGADRFPSTTTLQGSARTTEIDVEVVSDLSDLPNLGMTISRAVAELAEDGREPLVCFHSLTALMQYVSLERTFRFLNLLQSRMESTNHYHMDAEAHDQQTIATLRSLFDAVVEYEDIGAVS